MGRKEKQSQNPRSKAQLRLSFGQDDFKSEPRGTSRPAADDPPAPLPGKLPAPPEKSQECSILATQVSNGEDSAPEPAGSRNQNAADRVREAALTMARAKLRNLFSKSTADGENEGS